MGQELSKALAGRYLFERELGRGGMATVHLARDIRNEGHVALKVLHPQLAFTLGADRFAREIRVAARLDHPNILRVIDSGEVDGQLWFAMPFVEGESLWDRLKREGQITIPEALRITRATADALTYAHEQGVVHRDIKPDNILLSGDRVLVADFGVARALSEVQSKLTATGMIVGTPTYMSPEQASGELNLDGRSDIFGLACVLYEMLAGQPPFKGPTPPDDAHAAPHGAGPAAPPGGGCHARSGGGASPGARKGPRRAMGHRRPVRRCARGQASSTPPPPPPAPAPAAEPPAAPRPTGPFGAIVAAARKVFRRE